MPLVYASTTLALSVLELLVHLDPAAIPDDLIAIEAEIPDAVQVPAWLPADLPPGWRMDALLPVLRLKGEAWIRSGTSGVIRVPSVIVPSEANILINPAHADAAGIRVVARTPFSLDPRLF